jgi:hypothetical protein
MADIFEIQPYQTPIEVGDGITLIAPGLSGQGFHHGRREKGKVRADTLESAEFRHALEESKLEDVHTLILPPGAPAAVPEDKSKRTSGRIAADEIALTVPAEGAESQFVVYQDEDGVLSVEMPENPKETSSVNIRGTASGKVFQYKVRLRRSGGKSGTRGLLGVLGKKVIKIIARKLGVAVATKLAATIWEANARSFEGFHGSTKGMGRDSLDQLLTDNPQPFRNWKKLDGKKSLLFIHGTTSTTVGAFGALRNYPDLAKALFQNYQGVLAFNHHTLGCTIGRNIVQLYEELPKDDATYTFDIICHSRGGLLARTLNELDDAAISLLAKKDRWNRLPKVTIKIDHIIFVATPNIGTDLAAADNLPKWLNRMANLASFIPDSTGSAPLAAVLAVASDVAASAVSLPGLADMAPCSPFLQKLNARSVNAQDYWAVEAKYRAEGPLLRALEDPIIDGLFRGRDNDLVVPTEGVSIVGSTFDLTGPRVKKFSPAEGVSHTHFFTKGQTWQHILTALN